jgi:acetyl-CoA synthetase
VPVLAHRAKKFDPERTWALMKKHRVTNTFMPPTALKLMRQANIHPERFLLSVGSGGETLGAELLQVVPHLSSLPAIAPFSRPDSGERTRWE